MTEIRREPRREFKDGKNSIRYLGLELSGAKNPKTAVSTLEYYPKEGKVFLLDAYDRIVYDREDQEGPRTGDEALLSLLEELKPGVTRIGVNVPLAMPPCVICTRKSCPMPEKCNVPAVKWMREASRKAGRQHLKVLEFTPYTQRPVELWVRYQILSKLQVHERFEIDETLGGNKAPLTARMHFLRRHLPGIDLTEVWPKLSVVLLANSLGLSKRVISAYRQLEEGVHAREEILDKLVDSGKIFIYERDIRKLSQSLASFDSLICAYTALLADLGQTVPPPSGFPTASGWVHYPESAG